MDNKTQGFYIIKKPNEAIVQVVPCSFRLTIAEARKILMDQPILIPLKPGFSLLSRRDGKGKPNVYIGEGKYAELICGTVIVCMPDMKPIPRFFTNNIDPRIWCFTHDARVCPFHTDIDGVRRIHYPQFLEAGNVMAFVHDPIAFVLGIENFKEKLSKVAFRYGVFSGAFTNRGRKTEDEPLFRSPSSCSLDAYVISTKTGKSVILELYNSVQRKNDSLNINYDPKTGIRFGSL